MEEEKVFNFDDFLNQSFSKLKVEKKSTTSNKIIENIEFEDDKDEIEEIDNSKEEIEEPIEEEPIEEEPIEEPIKESIKIEENSNYYTLYKDISEEFICDISIDGVSEEDSQARIIIESKDWILLFPGEIKNKKCIVPIKSLKLFNEGEVGKIKLEVIAEGNIFIPWEDDFRVKISKKVEATVNKNVKNVYKPIQEKVKVQVKSK